MWIIFHFLLSFTLEQTYIPLLVYIFHYSEKNNCYAGVSMRLTLFCTLAHFNKHNVTFIKLGRNDENMMTHICVFGCFSLKETENLLNIWYKI